MDSETFVTQALSNAQPCLMFLPAPREGRMSWNQGRKGFDGEGVVICIKCSLEVKGVTTEFGNIETLMSSCGGVLAEEAGLQ